jgi:hypothetical protein
VNATILPDLKQQKRLTIENHKMSMILILDAGGKILYNRNIYDGKFIDFNHLEIKPRVNEITRHIYHAHIPRAERRI